MATYSVMPAVSVLMSVYNGRAFARDAVQSILCQTLDDFEFIIIDDGSTDGVTEDLQEFARLDPRIRLFSQSNQGLTKALNAGLLLARGEFIARMDSDDLSYPDRLEKQLAFLRSHRDLVCVGAEVELITADGTRLGPRRHPRGHAAIRSRLLAGDGGALTHPVTVFRRDCALSIFGFDEQFPAAQDLDFFLRLSEVGEIENMEATLLDWRQHPQSINRTQSHTWRALKSLAISKTISRIGAEAFAAQLFALEDIFVFPSDFMSLGGLALKNGRRSEAWRLFVLELRSGRNKRAACEQLARMSMCRIWEQLRAPVVFIIRCITYIYRQIPRSQY